ncbi:MAG: sugar ABC transporter substrate-binding protein [Propionibacteriaceae bacterium]|jgi:multiple sugar transport system substrate-binding protein|nr:sugar ABC transporter substrate-binding protein [Propionibacteriaceae bacterium]
MRSRQVLTAAVVAMLAAGPLVACTTEAEPQAPEKLTMWARSSTQDYSQRLVDVYNETHDPKIELTIVATDSFQQKVGAAAGAGSLPDILASDVVYAPNYAKQGVYQDITERINSFPAKDTLVQAHVAASTFDGLSYAVPHKVDSSFIFYNKDLFKKAGLDPEKAPVGYDAIYEAAKAIRALGGDTYGFYFPGNCAGCSAYTSFGVAAAAGELPISLDGKTMNIDSTSLADWFGLYRKLYAEDIVSPSAITGDTSTQQEPFLQGKAGIWPNGSYSIPKVEETVDFEWGYIPLSTADGSKTGTFVGGDVIGITSSTKAPDEAWKFIEWTLGDEAQIEIVAKDGNLPLRTDLASNKYTAADPRIEAITAGMANGYTPSTRAYGEAINSPNGPWLEAVRGAVFGDDPTSALKTGQATIQSLIDAAY